MQKYADGGGVTDPLAGMSPVDLARLRAELAAKPREMTVDERWRNYATTGADVAGSLPVIGNVMSTYDAYQDGKGAVDAAQAGDMRGAALNAAAAGLGALGAVTGLPWSKAAGEVARDARSTAAAFPLFHGTPHDVDRFRLDKIGTGEGAQVYGHGLYFAENPEVAKWYRDQLSKTHNAPGNVYRVDVNAEPEHFLDLDLPLVRQSPRVQEAIRKLGIEPVEYRDGHWLQKEIWRHADDDINENHWGMPGWDVDADTSRRLREAGLPGNRYLDQGSRRQAAGSRNYVIWDDGIIGPPTKEPYANGGTAARVAEYRRGGRVTVGAVEGATGGRTDALAVDVPEGAYVIPADVVAALGEGNTTAGMRQLEQQFGRPRRALGGAVVPIMVSDGEFVVSPEHVEAVGGADVLDRLVMQQRRAYADQLARMPGPKQ